MGKDTADFQQLLQNQQALRLYVLPHVLVFEFYNGIDWESLFEFVRHYYSIGVEYSSRRILVTSVVS